MLSADELSIGYGHSVIAGDIDLTISPGEVHCLLGPNGCGKTTLFRTLLGLLSPIHGRVCIDGRNIRYLSARDIATQLAYVPQNHAPPFSYSVADIVLMGRQARHGLFAAPSAQDRQRAEEALDRVGMLEYARSDYSRLSGGQRQLILIARALAQDAAILVLDEPTASLDYGNQIRIINEVARLAEDGRGIVLSTHNPEHAFAIATRVTIMREGHLQASGAPDDILTSQRLTQLYGIPISVVQQAQGPATCRPKYGA